MLEEADRAEAVLDCLVLGVAEAGRRLIGHSALPPPRPWFAAATAFTMASTSSRPVRGERSCRPARLLDHLRCPVRRQPRLSASTCFACDPRHRQKCPSRQRGMPAAASTNARILRLKLGTRARRWLDSAASILDLSQPRPAASLARQLTTMQRCESCSRSRSSAGMDALGCLAEPASLAAPLRRACSPLPPPASSASSRNSAATSIAFLAMPRAPGHGRGADTEAKAQRVLTLFENSPA